MGDGKRQAVGIWSIAGTIGPILTFVGVSRCNVQDRFLPDLPSNDRQVTEIGPPQWKNRRLSGLMGTTKMWYLFVLYSFRLVASGLHPQIHKAVSHNKWRAHTRIHEGGPLPLEGLHCILHQLPECVSRLHLINTSFCVKMITNEIDPQMQTSPRHTHSPIPSSGREAGVFPERITIQVLHVRAVRSFASLFGRVERENENGRSGGKWKEKQGADVPFDITNAGDGAHSITSNGIRY